MAKKTTVVASGRSAKLKAKWDDPTKGADGLTYRERQSKRQAERMRNLNALSRGVPPEPPAAPPAAPPPPPPAAPPPPPPAAPPSSSPPPAAQPSGRIGRLFQR